MIMTSITMRDKNDLEPDDEFYDLNFTQLANGNSLNVKPCTYALMTWWKMRMGNQDTLDISDDSNTS